MGFIFFIMGFAGGLAWGIRELRRLRTRYLLIGQDCRELISDNARLRHQNRQLSRRNEIEITEDELAELARRNS